MENVPEINQRVKKARELLKLSQKAVSEKLGLKPSYYSGVENGKRKVTSRIVEGLRNNYNVSAEWLYTGNGESLLTNSTLSRTLNDVPALYPDEPKEQEIDKKSKESYWLRFGQLLRESKPEYYQVIADVIKISNLEDLITDFEKSKFGNTVYFGMRTNTIKSFSEFKNIGFQAIEQVLPYAGIVHDFTLAAEEFIRELNKVKDKIDLDFDFEDYIHDSEEDAFK